MGDFYNVVQVCGDMSLLNAMSIVLYSITDREVSLRAVNCF
jgi:hypothetical protein